MKREGTAARRTTDRALVLHRAPYGESSLVVRVLTSEHGPQSLIAKGAHRQKSAFAWTLDLFHELELTFRPGLHGGLGSLERGTLLRRRRRIPTNIQSYLSALSALEVVELVAMPGQDERPLFQHLTRLLDALDCDGGGTPSDALAATFETSVLAHLGLMPALLECASCGTRTEDGPRAPFSAGLGGRLCHTCASQAKAAGKKVGTLPVQELIDLARAARGQAPSDLGRARAARTIAARFLAFHLGTIPRTHRALVATDGR